MKNITLNLLSLFLIITCSLQAKPVTDQFHNFPNFGIFSYNTPVNSKLNQANPGTQPEAEASHYNNYKFRKGTVIVSEYTLPVEIRYNVTKDEMECKIKNQFCRITSPKKISSITIGNEKFVYKQFNNKKEKIYGYLQEIHTGNKKVYVRHYSQSVNRKTKIAKLKTYYLVEDSNELKIVKNSKEIVAQFYPQQMEIAKQYMSSNHLNWNNTKGINLLLNYLDNFASNNVASR